MSRPKNAMGLNAKTLQSSHHSTPMPSRIYPAPLGATNILKEEIKLGKLHFFFIYLICANFQLATLTDQENGRKYQ